MDMVDQEFYEIKDNQLKCADELLNKIGKNIIESNCDEGDILVVATVFLARAVRNILPFLPIASGPLEGPMATLENVEDILKSTYSQVKHHLKEYEKENTVH